MCYSSSLHKTDDLIYDKAFLNYEICFLSEQTLLARMRFWLHRFSVFMTLLLCQQTNRKPTRLASVYYSHGIKKSNKFLCGRHSVRNLTGCHENKRVSIYLKLS
jgi:hypothetical protein